MSLRPTNPPPDLRKFAYFPKFEYTIEKLAELAQDENWEYKLTYSSQKKPILINYFNYTFKRCFEERKVIELNDKACFNTGLVTNNQEEIFAFFVPNSRSNFQEKWFFKYFCKASDYNLRDFDPLPEGARYFEDPTNLVYDVRLGIPRIDYDHIMDDPRNRERFPEPYKSMTNYQLQVFLEGGIKLAMKRVNRNYKAAVPQFFWDKNATAGELQLLLPLCLIHPSKADVALAVNRTNNVYSGETILTLDMAYNNARLLARPDTEWLQP